MQRIKYLFSRLVFSKTLLAKRTTQKITATSLMTALCVVINTLEIKLGGVQFSLTIFISAFAGLFLGGLSGFSACFLGDLIGFFLHPMGEYAPWIGISTGLMALIPALLVSLPKAHKLMPFYLAVSSLLCFVVCTSGITTWYLNRVWFKSMTFTECLFTRLFVQGQIWNSVFNAVLTVAVLPLIAKVKPLGIKV